MMRLEPTVLAALTLATPLAAQGNPQCDTYQQVSPQARNVCNAAVDGAALFVPVAGILVTAGNPLLGSARSLGGLGHLGITLRVNGTQLVIPDLSYRGVGTTVGAKQAILAPAPLVEGGFGIFRGTGNGSMALDLLGSAQLLPTKLLKDVAVDVNARAIGTIALGLGVGGRLTLVGEHGAVPGIMVSVMHRSLPRIGVGDVLKGDAYSFASDLGSMDYRATIGTHLGPLAIGAGGGWTTYRADGDVIYSDPVTGTADAPVAFSVRDSRKVGFLDAGLILGHANLIGEAGIQQGKDLGLVTTFVNNDPKQQRVFGSVGLRIGF